MSDPVNKQIVFDARAYVAFWFRINNRTVRQSASNPHLLDTMLLDYEKLFQQYRFQNPDSKARSLNHKLIESALKEYIGIKLEQEVAAALDAFKVEKENLNPLRAWLRAVTGADSDQDVAVIAHWIWQIKRKAYQLPVVYHIMPILVGAQNGGKSTAIAKLIKPIEKFRLITSMHQLNDERVCDGLARNYVVLFDELQGIERTDINALKKQITTTENSYRRLHTHIMVTVPQRCSFIGASNKPVAETFSDSTGMRRFWELKTLDTLNWPLLNEIDYEELWCGIDEGRERGYLVDEILSTVLKTQQQMVNKDDLDIFIEENLLADDGPQEEISAATLYEHYVHWAGRKGIYNKLNAIWFGRKNSSRLKSIDKRDEQGVKYRSYLVCSKSPVFQKDVLKILKGGS